ncbi:hypothetical protein MesoLj131a_51120 [Mesorhizobium sp. 131-2-1]|nr:hypothetical protein MesoLj131a_51120 [Mesorhizobium sp. 131-2-1]
MARYGRPHSMQRYASGLASMKGSGFSPVECRVDSEFNARRRDCKIRVTKFDVYVKRRLEAA